MIVDDEYFDIRCRISSENPKAIIEETEIERLELKLDDQMLKAHKQCDTSACLCNVPLDIDQYGSIVTRVLVESIDASTNSGDAANSVVSILQAMRTRTWIDAYPVIFGLLDRMEANRCFSVEDFINFLFTCPLGCAMLEEDENIWVDVIRSTFGTKWHDQLVRLFASRCLRMQGFVVCALRSSFLAILAEDDWYLDDNRESMVSHFSSTELQRRFGTDGTRERRLVAYGDIMCRKLASLCVSILKALLYHMPTLPGCVHRIFKEIVNMGKDESWVMRFFVCDLLGPYFNDPISTGLVKGTFVTPIGQYNISRVFAILQDYLCLPERSRIGGTVFDIIAKEERHELKLLIMRIAESDMDCRQSSQNCFDLSRDIYLLSKTELNKMVCTLDKLQEISSAIPRVRQSIVSACTTQMSRFLADIDMSAAENSSCAVDNCLIIFRSRLASRIPSIRSRYDAKPAIAANNSIRRMHGNALDSTKRIRFSFDDGEASHKINEVHVFFNDDNPRSESAYSAANGGRASVEDTISSGDNPGTGSIEEADKNSADIDFDSLITGRDSPNNDFESSERCSVNSGAISAEMPISVGCTPNVTDRFNMFELPPQTSDSKLNQSDNWSIAVGVSECDPAERMNRLCDVVEEDPAFQELIRMQPVRISSRDSDLWSVEPLTDAGLSVKSDEDISDDNPEFDASLQSQDNTREADGLCGLDISLSKWESCQKDSSESINADVVDHSIALTDHVSMLMNTLAQLVIQSDPAKLQSPLSTTSQLGQFLNSNLKSVVHRGDFRMQMVLYKAANMMSSLDSKSARSLLDKVSQLQSALLAYFEQLKTRREAVVCKLQQADLLLINSERMYESATRGVLHRIVLTFLERHEIQTKRFVINFIQNRSTITDRVFYLRKFLRYLYNIYETTSFSRLKTEKSADLDCSRSFIERYVVSQIYSLAIYPNGQANIDADRLFNHQLQLWRENEDGRCDNLFPLLTYSKDRQIPWARLSIHISLLNAFKTCGDKLRHIVDCIDEIERCWINAQIQYDPSRDIQIAIIQLILRRTKCPSLLSNVRYIDQFKSSNPVSDFSAILPKWELFNSAFQCVKSKLSQFYRTDHNGLRIGRPT